MQWRPAQEAEDCKVCKKIACIVYSRACVKDSVSKRCEKVRRVKCLTTLALSFMEGATC